MEARQPKRYLYGGIRVEENNVREKSDKDLEGEMTGQVKGIVEKLGKERITGEAMEVSMALKVSEGW